MTLGDGEVVSPAPAELRGRRPRLRADARRTLQLSPRVAPQMIGLGLLEAVPEADILALADPDDADGDGISGRPNIVLVGGVRPADARPLRLEGRAADDPRRRRPRPSPATSASRRALQPTAWGDCTEARGRLPRPRRTAATPEADDTVLDLVTFYSRNLAVPARRDLGRSRGAARQAGVLRGRLRRLPHIRSSSPTRLADQPEQSFQLIWPYTDLLLHDMGEGLADDRPEARATGREWRTAPLWGIGLTETVTGQASFLHDGRARTLLEAVLWHGGEAQAARDAVAALPEADREALIRFLESL